ncbi:hypothetical protein TIFTF001_010799 [Ficus carica]|uniref:F-box domain-containing protein n=1 Tax=Ficus carica TaxID=3494 RepID=A0AA88A981_FICCA|nr:hypothetical protein TIFTF001_010799 [Ficus carica]
MAKDRKVHEEETQEEAPIYGDILETVLSHVPLIDLVSASQVSRSWSGAVSSSLRHLKRIKPWLIVHTQSTRPPYATTAHAYDPRSGDWIQIHHQPPTDHVSALRSSHSTLSYMLSPSKFAFSSDPLRLTWHVVDAPLVWRTDPIVAEVGDSVVVAGGACDYEDDPLSVEVYDRRNGEWSACQSMPAMLKDSAASTSLSVAVHGGKMYVAEKCSGLTHSFDPNSKAWRGPYDLRPDQGVFCLVIESAGGNLIAVGVVGSPESIKTVKMWKFSGESLEDVEVVGEMPEEMVEKLKGESSYVPSVNVVARGSFVFIHNPSEPEEVIQCDIGNGRCRWGSVRNAVVNDTTRMQRMVVGCSDVAMVDLRKAMLMDDSLRFAAKHLE